MRKKEILNNNAVTEFDNCRPVHCQIYFSTLIYIEESFKSHMALTENTIVEVTLRLLLR